MTKTVHLLLTYLLFYFTYLVLTLQLVCLYLVCVKPKECFIRFCKYFATQLHLVFLLTKCTSDMIEIK